jgi:hypothetical protein
MVDLGVAVDQDVPESDDAAVLADSRRDALVDAAQARERFAEDREGAFHGGPEHLVVHVVVETQPAVNRATWSAACAMSARYFFASSCIKQHLGPLDRFAEVGVLDRARDDEVDRQAAELLERLVQAEIAIGVAGDGRGGEVDQEVDVAGRARRRQPSRTGRADGRRSGGRDRRARPDGARSLRSRPHLLVGTGSDASASDRCVASRGE